MVYHKGWGMIMKNGGRTARDPHVQASATDVSKHKDVTRQFRQEGLGMCFSRGAQAEVSSHGMNGADSEDDLGHASCSRFQYRQWQGPMTRKPKKFDQCEFPPWRLRGRCDESLVLCVVDGGAELEEAVGEGE